MECRMVICPVLGASDLRVPLLTMSVVAARGRG